MVLCVHLLRFELVVAAGGPEALASQPLATPARVTRGSTVRLRLTARERSARGAFADRLSYGDGTASPPTALPQFCIAGTPPPASRTWRFSHRNHAAGTYHLTATVFVNCTSDHATTLVTVHVK